MRRPRPTSFALSEGRGEGRGRVVAECGAARMKTSCACAQRPRRMCAPWWHKRRCHHLRDALHDGCLADARLAGQNGVVFGAAEQNLRGGGVGQYSIVFGASEQNLHGREPPRCYVPHS
eukprot:360766-Chlamydomonas_euryale.AAC.6